jgi:hypothetical protein
MKLESLKKYELINNNQKAKVIGGLQTCTNVYSSTNLPTENGSDTCTATNDWSGFTDDGGGCGVVTSGHNGQAGQLACYEGRMDVLFYVNDRGERM